jgi:hypothetical protein
VKKKKKRRGGGEAAERRRRSEGAVSEGAVSEAVPFFSEESVIHVGAQVLPPGTAAVVFTVAVTVAVTVDVTVAVTVAVPVAVPLAVAVDDLSRAAMHRVRTVDYFGEKGGGGGAYTA